MMSIVACCHSAKLCAHTARDFRSQQNGAVNRMWRSCRVQLSHKERVIGVVRCEKKGMLLQPLRWCYVDYVIHSKRDVQEEQKYICAVRASNNKRDCDAWSLLLLAAMVRSFAHVQLGISDCNTTGWPISTTKVQSGDYFFNFNPLFLKQLTCNNWSSDINILHRSAILIDAVF